MHTEVVPREIRTRAVDATEELLFEVTREDMFNGVPKSITDCGGACGINRLPVVYRAWVRNYITYVEFEDGSVKRYMNPAEIVRQVRNNDYIGLFEQGTYTLRPPRPSWGTEARRKRARSYVGAVDEKDRQRPKKKRRAYALR